MSSLNRAQLIGNIGKIGEVKKTKETRGGAKPYINFSVATSEWSNGDDRTEWHNVVCYEKQAEFVNKYLDKGSLVLVEGRIKTRKWTDKSGKENYFTEIVAHSVKALGKKGANMPAFAKEQKPEEPYSGFDGDMDDIPF